MELFSVLKSILKGGNTESVFRTLSEAIPKAIDDERFSDLSDLIWAFDHYAQEIPLEISLFVLTLTKVAQDEIPDWETVQDSIGSKLESDPVKRAQIMQGL